MEVWIGESDTKNITQATLYAHVYSGVAAAVLMNTE